MARRTSKTTNDVIVTGDTPQTLSQRYILLQNTADKLVAPRKWEWARDVSAMLDCTPDKSSRTAHSETLGTLIGTELRGKPYGGSWVRQHVAAYKRFEAGITTQEEFRAFLQAVNGNAGPSKQAKAEETPVSDTDGGELDSDGEVANDFLTKITKAVKRAIAAGLSVTEIQDAVADGIPVK